MASSPFLYIRKPSPFYCLQEVPTRSHRLRVILITRFFLNLRHIFFKEDPNSPETLSSFNVRIPTIASEDLVGNLGAPLRDSFTSEPRASGSSYTTLPSWSPDTSMARLSTSSMRRRQKRRDKGKARADPLLDWDVDDLDDEDLDDVEIVASRPMLVGLGIEPNVKGGGSVVSPVWKRGFNGIGAEGEEAISLMNRDGSHSAAQTPIRSAHPEGQGDRSSLPPSRQPSKSTVDEGDALLVDAGENDDGYARDSMISSVASTMRSEGLEVSPRRTSYF